jgi:8-oxo-dGTP pyrophosphatase MutT (NUDIX family)
LPRLDSITSSDFFELIGQRLKKSKPGWPAQSALLPEPRPGNIPFYQAEPFCRKAGVLLLLYPRNNRLHLLFTRRTADVLHHRGEISFPGGAREEGENMIQAAFRETYEELNISPDSYLILGKLTPLYIPPSRFCIYPCAAGALTRPDFVPEPREVEEVIEIPLSHLLNEKNLLAETWTVRGEKRKIPFFQFQENKIWGATAMVLAEFLEVVKSAIRNSFS